jgi:hypothetical protein
VVFVREEVFMNNRNKLKIVISALLVIGALLVLFGKTVIKGPGFTLTYKFIDALNPASEAGFRTSTTVYCWILLAGGIIGAVLVWLKPVWAKLITCVIGFIPPIFHIINNLRLGYGPFSFDGVCEFFMFFCPLAAAVLTIILIVKFKEEDKPQE